MNSTSKKFLILGIVVAAIVGTHFLPQRFTHLGSLALSPTGAGGTYEIQLGKDGFTPSEISIPVNSTVVFTDTTGNPFWPASDFHPTHTIYPEFDPKRPIDGNASWSFKFEKVGKWRYHDHLEPYFTGTINVLDVKGQAENIDCKNFTASTTMETRDKCWNEDLFAALNTGGTKTAMAELQTLYETDPKFIEDGCHRWAHVVGDMAFYKYGYAKGNVDTWDLPLETTYCGYGFFHGIFEHFFRANPDLVLARKICDRLTKTLGTEIPRIRQNCFHGVGHGFMPEPPPTAIWGDPKAMMTAALDACEKVSPTDDPGEKKECMEGSFNVMADWMQQNKYGLSVNMKDPLGFCLEQTNRDRTLGCFYEYSMRVTNYANDDLVKIANEYIKPTIDDELAKMIINSAAASLLERHLSETNYDYLVKECHAIPERLQQDCLFGLNGGFLAHGEPGKEYVKAIAVCDSKELSEKEKDACFQNLTLKFTWNYPKDKISGEVCPAVPARFEHYCKT